VEIVLTHSNMDFDSLAAQLAVTKLYPAARIVLGYPLTGNVRSFLSLYRSSLPIVQSKYLDLESVTRVFIVDCQHAGRLDAAVHRLITDGQCKYTIFDHHAIDPESLMPGASQDSIVERVGSATTVLVKRVRDQKIPLTPFEATLLAIGIYEDTGCLTYQGTTEDDATCVAYLLSKGADVAIVNEYIRPKLDDEQVALLQDLVKDSQTIDVGGARVVIAKASREKYLDGLATLTRKLTEVQSCDAAFTVVHMRDRTHIVGRSDTPFINARDVARRFGGDGHPGAASAVTRTGTTSDITEDICKMLKEQEQPERQARHVMTSPVRTIKSSVPMDEASRIMIRYGLDGLVVAEDNKVVGIVSRRDIDQATHHKLGHAPVLGFMSRPVISIEPDTPLSKIQYIMAHEDIGRLPVLDKENRLLGVVTRQDVLRTLYGGDSSHDAGLVSQAAETLNFPSGRRAQVSQDLRRELEELDEHTVWLCKHVGASAASLNMVAYAVGGFVRDLILNRPNFDLDYVIEGAAIELADTMQAQYPNKLKVVARHERFQTATLDYQADRLREVDFSTARTEFYEFPAALPTVEPSKLEQDLLRRDFTINSMAICLNPDRFGKLVDHFDGLSDLKRKVIRILHAFSFIEDPTRIIRAVRFASRLGFTLEPKTKEQAKRAIAMGIFDNLGGVRMRAELKMILESPQRLKALDLLFELGGKLRYLDSELEYGLGIKKLIRRAERLLLRHTVLNPWLVYLGLLLSNLPPERVQQAVDRLHLANDQKTMIQKGLDVLVQMPEALNKLSFERRRSIKPSQIYALLHGKHPESLAIAACLAKPGSPMRRMIWLYLEKLEHIRIDISGHDLVKMGYTQGPVLGQALASVHEAKLDGAITTREEELSFALKLLPTLSKS
jgi:tRNA nucleotidyltransferase (CCA-adding enzyme)